MNDENYDGSRMSPGIPGHISYEQCPHPELCLSDSRVMDMAGWQHYPEHADTGGTKLVFKWEMRRGFKVGEIIIAKYILHLFKL